MIELNIYEPHPFKRQLEYYEVRQFDLAKSLGISQSSLSKMLSGICPMKSRIEDQISELLMELKSKKKQH